MVIMVCMKNTLYVQVKVSEKFMAGLDKWRGSQQPIPSRAEAVRRLVSIALAKPKKAA